MGSKKSHTRMGFSSSGFSLVEVMIAVLLASLLSLMGINFLKANSSRLADEQVSNQSSEGLALLQKQMLADFRNLVALNPACDDNAPTTFISGDCSDLKVRGAITPLPGASKEDLDNLDNFLPNSNATTQQSISKAVDAVRLVTYDFDGSFNCKLNPRHKSTPNPSQSLSTASGDERLWAHPQCGNLLQVGRIYIVSEEIDGVTFSNVFQVTALATVNLSDATQEIQVDARSSTSAWNQRFGLGAAGYSASARIYPIKLVEWAVGDSGGLWRREISPAGEQLIGKGEWQLMSDQVEGLQFYFLTGGNSSFVSHHRKMSFSSDTRNNGFEDIRGLTPHIVIKSTQSSKSANRVYDNPHTAEEETDSYPRQELSFFATIINQ